MSLRPAKCYRKTERAYTRKSRVKSKDYVKGVPEIKIHRYEHGIATRNFPLKLFLTSDNKVQIRHNSLEAARISLTKNLDKRMPKDSFFLKILVYPHHVLRENVLATGAGADRFQSGMRLSFGKPIGTAAQVRNGQRVIMVSCNPENEAEARKCLKIASSKLPTPCTIEKVLVAAQPVAVQAA